MTIERIEDDGRVSQRCEGCGRARELPLAELAVGSTLAHEFDARCVCFPPCPNCRAREVLIGSAEGEVHPSPGSRGHLHQLLVDHLRATLITKERVLPDVVKRRGALKPLPVPKEELARWFSGGLSLPQEP